MLRLYLLATLSARLGDPAALEHARELDAIPGTADAEALARDLAFSVRAQWAYWSGEYAIVLEELDRRRLAPRRIVWALRHRACDASA